MQKATLSMDFSGVLRSGCLSGIERVAIEYFRAFGKLGVSVRAVRVHKGVLYELESAKLLELLDARMPRQKRMGGSWKNIFLPLPPQRKISPEGVIFCADVWASSNIPMYEKFSARVALFHDAVALRYPQLASPKTVARFPSYMKELRSFTRVLTPSEHSRGELVGYWGMLEGEKNPTVEIVEHGVGPLPRQELLKNPLGELPLLLCLGTLEARKNQGELLKAYKRLWLTGYKFRLAVIGAMAASGRKFAEEIEKLRHEGMPIEYHGALPDAKVEKLWSSAWALVYPSVEEGFGLPVAEALARGVPVVCSTGGALAERVKLGGCEVALNSESDGLGEALRNIFNPQRREALAAEAAELSPKRWEDAAREVIKNFWEIGYEV